MGDRVVGLAGAGFADMLDVLASGADGRAKIENLVQSAVRRGFPACFGRCSRRSRVRRSSFASD